MTADVVILCDVQNCPGAQMLVVTCDKVVLVRLCDGCLKKISIGQTRTLKDGRQISMRYIGPDEHKSCSVAECHADAVQYMRIVRHGARPLEVYLCVGHDQPDQVLKLDSGLTLHQIT